MKKWILLDCDYLCHRAKHSMGHLEYGETPTGVIYGFLKGLTTYEELFRSHRFVFCWDSRYSKRKEIYSEYKANRNKTDLTDEEIKFEQEFRKQMKKLRRVYLKTIGFRNVFQQKGYESDDLIASIVFDLPSDEEAVIVTSDKDLYQCLIRDNIVFYNPQKQGYITKASFKIAYGIEPQLWPVVKAIAGCATDNVKGITGVGETTAIKYLNSMISEGKKYEDITSPMGIKIAKDNERLVRLPMPGTKKFKLKRDVLSNDGWKQVTKLLGMKSIRDRIPFGRL